MISLELEQQIEEFKNLAWPVIIDPPDVHSEFVPKLDGSIMHGPKRDYGRLKPGSSLRSFWYETMAHYMHETSEEIDILLGIANGAIPLAEAIGRRLNANYGRDITVLSTVKLPSGVVILGRETEEALENIDRDRVITEVDDEGTGGTTARRPAERLRELGFQSIDAVYSSQRSETLRFLDEANPPIPNRSMIRDPLPTFPEEVCRAEELCHRGVYLEPYKR